MNINLKRLSRKKGRCFKKAKKSGMDEDNARYGSKRHSLQVLELSQRTQDAMPDLQFFGHAGHADPLDGWRSQKRVMSRPIQVRQLKTRKSGFVISAINKYMSESRYQ